MKSKLKPLSIFLSIALTAVFLFTACFDEEHNELQSSQIVIIEAAMQTIEITPSRAELVAKALATAYPTRIEKAEFRNDDWAMLIDDTWFYYAEGRLLPEELRENVSEYGSIFFYNYQRELPPWTPLSQGQWNRTRDMSNERRTWRPRSSYFFDAIYQARNRSESYERVKTIQFLGYNITVHSLILDLVAQIEKEILSVAENNPQVRVWVNEINLVEGWNWRNVAGSQARSYHSYGAAIDILPRSLGGLATYWQWSSEWWNIPYERRYHPPDAVIEIFESYGFYWGGRWMHFFDTMHFEYRPEVFILSGYELATPP